MDPALIQRVLAHYPSASAWDRFHLRHRLNLCPYETLLPHLPRSGRLLDIGCGFAHLGWFLAETDSALEYFGCDIDARKMALALAGINPEATEIHKLRLFSGTVFAWNGLPSDFHAITVLDVLYLLPLPLQESLLDFACDHLAQNPEAVLLLKILPPLRGWAKWRTWAQERLMIRLGKTVASGALAPAQDPQWYLHWARGRGLDGEAIPLPASPPSTLLALRRQ